MGSRWAGPNGETGAVPEEFGSTWRFEDRRGSAQELHGAAVGDPVAGRAVVVQHVSRPALVLGSSQGSADVDEGFGRRSGVDLARRRSGGGAVLLGTDDHIWVDLVVPAGDVLADDDVVRAAAWVGELWVRALGLGPLEDSGRLVRHDGRWSDRDLGARACFAAVGPGELVLDGRKVLGISQRRTRAGARFQCLAYRRWDPESLLGLLAGAGGSEWADGPGPDALRSALVERAGAVVPDGWDVVERLLPVLP